MNPGDPTQGLGLAGFQNANLLPLFNLLSQNLLNNLSQQQQQHQLQIQQQPLPPGIGPILPTVSTSNGSQQPTPIFIPIPVPVTSNSSSTSAPEVDEIPLPQQLSTNGNNSNDQNRQQNNEPNVRRHRRELHGFGRNVFNPKNDRDQNNKKMDSSSGRNTNEMSPTDQRNVAGARKLFKVTSGPFRSPKKSGRRRDRRFNRCEWEKTRSRAPIPRRPSNEPWMRQPNGEKEFWENKKKSQNAADRLPASYGGKVDEASSSDEDEKKERKVDINEPRIELDLSTESVSDRSGRRREDSRHELDFGDVGESDLSDTDEELLSATQGLTDSKHWTQSAPARMFYKRKGSFQTATERLKELERKFKSRVLSRFNKARREQEQSGHIPPSSFYQKCTCGHGHTSDSDDKEKESSLKYKRRKMRKRKPDKKKQKKSDLVRNFISSSSSQNSSSSTESESEDGLQSQRFSLALKELERKQNHPSRLHEDIWFNEKGQMNDGPLCRCSWKSRHTGIRHQIYPGESKIESCDPYSNNSDKLYHYVINIIPKTNMKTRIPTVICHDDHDYVFEGFSLFSHEPLPEKLPLCRVNRWNIDYTIQILTEDAPDGFCVRDLELFSNYFFDFILEFYDMNRRAFGIEDGCPVFHLMPRFSRKLDDDGKELVPMSAVLAYLMSQCRPVVSEQFVSALGGVTEDEWVDFVSNLKGQLVTNPSRRPCTIRLDMMDRQTDENGRNLNEYPLIVHFGIRPSVLTYAGNPDYQKHWKQYVKFRHLLMMQSKISAEDREKLSRKEAHLQQLKAQTGMKRDVTSEISSYGFCRTGLYSDIVQQGIMVLSACNHIRFHWCLKVFERDQLQYEFKNRALLELAFTHPSFRNNCSTNPDHIRNTLANCGVRQPEFNRRNTQQVTSRKRGINTLIDIMSRMGSKRVKQSLVANNERLEYLGDAVVEFLTTTHLFFMFSDLDEGGLATYRSSLVQNKHLAVLAKKLHLDDFMLYAHGPDLCHEADLKHAMANAFEALMGSIFLDGGLDEGDKIFGRALFNPETEASLYYVWTHPPKHPLQQEESEGDRHWIPQVKALQELTRFEGRTGIQFKHIRLLARALTRRNVGYNFLTHGHNQRLEFLGDTVLQLITSEYLYKHFPEHHEGHLSLLRSCLVNNKTQSVICDDLGLTQFLIQPPSFLKTASPDLRIKDKADLVESFLGALYVDRGLQWCKIFCKVCFYPRLKFFIVSQRWNDPKSQLQQCCLTLRNPDGGEPDIPQYKVIGVEGPTNTRIYRVAVYFRTKRLSAGVGHSVQEAEMRAAEAALRAYSHKFPHLQRQRRFISKRFGANAGIRATGRILDKYTHLRNRGTLPSSPQKQRQWQSSPRKFTFPMKQNNRKRKKDRSFHGCNFN